MKNDIIIKKIEIALKKKQKLLIGGSIFLFD